MILSLVVISALGGLGAWWYLSNKDEPIVEKPPEEKPVVVEEEAVVGDRFEGRRNAHGIFYVPIDEVLAKVANRPAEEGEEAK